MVGMSVTVLIHMKREREVCASCSLARELCNPLSLHFIYSTCQAHKQQASFFGFMHAHHTFLLLPLLAQIHLLVTVSLMLCYQLSFISGKWFHNTSEIACVKVEKCGARTNDALQKRVSFVFPIAIDWIILLRKQFGLCERKTKQQMKARSAHLLSLRFAGLVLLQCVSCLRTCVRIQDTKQ